MFEYLSKWFNRHFASPEAMLLLVITVIGVIAIVFLGQWLAPLLAGLVIAFLLESLIKNIQKLVPIPRWLCSTIAYLLFLTILLAIIFILIPLLWQQFSQIISDLPKTLQRLHHFLNQLTVHYPALFSKNTINDLFQNTNVDISKVTSIGKVIFSASLASMPSIVSWLVYLFLVPLVVLFLLKDKTKLTLWCRKSLASENTLVLRVWSEMQQQLGAYVNGKVLECIIIGIITYIGFRIFGLEYAPLLAFFVGLSCVIPYIGMVVVTISVVIIGLVQWGFAPVFFYNLLVYFIIQAIDGNILVPVLYSEAVNLHPIAIIAAILVFGGLWGFWGLFFAIPLATLVKCLINAWSTPKEVVNV